MEKKKIGHMMTPNFHSGRRSSRGGRGCGAGCGIGGGVGDDGGGWHW